MIWADYKTVRLKRKCRYCGKRANGEIVKIESIDPYDRGSYLRRYFCCKECAKEYIAFCSSKDTKSADRVAELNKYILDGEEE